jgi:hypothetical protein
MTSPAQELRRLLPVRLPSCAARLLKQKKPGIKKLSRAFYFPYYNRITFSIAQQL